MHSICDRGTVNLNLVTALLIFSLLFLMPSMSIPPGSAGLNAMATENNTDWIGIRMADPGPALIQKLGLNESTGVVVSEVIPGGPAESAGIRGPDLRLDNSGKSIEIVNADVILKVDKIPVRNATDIGSIIKAKNAGENLTLTIFRDHQVREATVAPVAKPSYLIFKDPESLYTVKYPANWTVAKMDLWQQLAQKTRILNPQEIQQVGVALFLKPSDPPASISIVRNPGRITGLTDTQMKTMADEGFAGALIQYNGTIVQDIECKKYHIDGEKACSYVLGIGENGTFRNVMQVLTVVGERSYVISYSTSPENFDKYLPILKTMLQSFERTETSATTVS